jgi:steroid delta-isomerase-like uncharacterized protein
MTRFTLDAYESALERKDAGAILAMLAEDVEVVDLATGIVVRGKAAVRTSLERSLQAIDRVELDVRMRLEQEDAMALLVQVRGAYGQDVPADAPRGKVAGKSFDLPVAVFLRLDGEGRLRHATRILDMTGVLRQLGLEEGDLEAMVPLPAQGAA